MKKIGFKKSNQLILGFFLILILSVSVFVGCSKKDENKLINNGIQNSTITNEGSNNSSVPIGLTPNHQIGHRDANNNAVLDITSSTLFPSINAEMTLRGFSNVQITYLDISDNVNVAGYFQSIGIKVVYDDGENKGLSISLLYPISYSPLNNIYTLKDYELLPIMDGGRPDKNFCVATNCVGCASIRNDKGKLTGCTDCNPSSIDMPFSCTVENTAGTGAGRVLTALGGILKGLKI